MKTVKRILAIIAIILILVWFGATFVIGVFPFSFKASVLPVMLAGCVFFPLMIWIVLWAFTYVTGKKNIASFDPNEKNIASFKSEDENEANKSDSE